MKRKIFNSIKGKGMLSLLFLYLIAACTPEPIIWDPRADQLVIAQYIANDSTKFSEFNKLLLNTQLNSFLSIRGPYTLFLPNDSAMKVYYASKNISSVDQLDEETQRNLVLNHLVLAEIGAGDIGLGAIRQTNAINDKLATDFVGSDIYINKVAKIIDRDTKVSNGIIHEVDHVLEPITFSLFDLVSSDPNLSLFTKGLEITGIKDTLNIVEFPFGTKMARTYFTIFAVPDTIFNRYGIYSIEDMINYFTDEPGKITEEDNGFYQYIEYHCLNGSHFLSDLVPDPAVNPQLYPILSFNNNVSVRVAKDFYINEKKAEGTYTSFLVEQSNRPAKNGALHVVNDLLPVVDPEPTNIIFDTCEYLDIMQGDYYMKYYKKWYDGQNTFQYIKWEGDYLQYYYKNHDAPVQKNFDGLQMIGHWWLEVTTPKVMKGSYSMSGYVWGGRVCDVYVDGVKVAHIGASDSDRYAWGEFHWDTTREHTVRLVSTAYSTVFWDTIELTPISQ